MVRNDDGIEAANQRVERMQILVIKRTGDPQRHRDAMQGYWEIGADTLQHLERPPPRLHKILADNFEPIDARRLLQNRGIVLAAQAYAYPQSCEFAEIKHRARAARS